MSNGRNFTFSPTSGNIEKTHTLLRSLEFFDSVKEKHVHHDGEICQPNSNPFFMSPCASSILTCLSLLQPLQIFRTPASVHNSLGTPSVDSGCTHFPCGGSRWFLARFLLTTVGEIPRVLRFQSRINPTGSSLVGPRWKESEEKLAGENLSSRSVRWSGSIDQSGGKLGFKLRVTAGGITHPTEGH